MLTYLLIRVFTFPLGWLPLTAIHWLGRRLGSIAYYVVPKYRKRALSNLAIASDLHLRFEEIPRIAKASIQSLMVTCLEYAKFAKTDRLEKLVQCENPQEAEAILKQGNGVIFFCGHQANWEVLFLDGTRRMPGVAIGRPIKNQALYNWVLSIRERFGGKIISPQNAIKEGLRALKKGSFLGIVGDQGMPNSGYRSPFLGRPAWTSPISAILSYRTGAPVIVATTRRERGKYLIHYSEPIYPNQEESLENETQRIMGRALSLFQESIKQRPEEWLWTHNRWKQQLPGRLKRAFRHDTLCIILPEDREQFEAIVPHLSLFRELYPLEWISLLTPEAFRGRELLSDCEYLYYQTPRDLLLHDYRFKLVFDFTNSSKVRRHFLRLSSFSVLSLSGPYDDLTNVLTKTLCHAR